MSKKNEPKSHSNWLILKIHSALYISRGDKRHLLTTLIIVNPAAGKGLAKTTLTKLQAYLEDKQVDFAVYITQKAGDNNGIREALRRNPSKFLSVLGGDGTLHEVINSSPMVFSRIWHIIPCGIANNFARSFYGALLEPSFFFDRITDPLAFQIDVGRLNHLMFLGGVGLGMGARVHDALKHSVFRHLSGRIAFSLVMISNLINPEVLKFDLTPTSDQLPDFERKKFIAIEILKSPYVGKGYQLFDDIKMNNQLLRCSFFTKAKMIPRFKIYKKLDEGSFNKAPEAVFSIDLPAFKFKTLTPQIFHADGEIYHGQSFEFSIHPTPLSILI